MRPVLVILVGSVLIIGGDLAVAADECGFKAVRARWNFPAFPGLQLHVGDSEGVNSAVFVPAGKDMITADRSLGIAAQPKSESGPTLADFTRKTIQYYVNESRGGTMASIGTTPGPDGKPIGLYQLKPGPRTPENVFYQTSAFFEDSYCFIDLFFSAKSAQVHDTNVAALKQFLSQLKRR